MARKLLSRGEAAVFRRAPFTIILKREVSDVQTPDLQLKIDPGSKTTGIAIVNQQTGEVIFAAEINHRGHDIKKSIDARRAVRRSRRNRKTRYRKPRFNNRRRSEGWLPPSLESRVENVYTWSQRLRRIYPIKGISMELVKFDMQLMENPEIGAGQYPFLNDWGPRASLAQETLQALSHHRAGARVALQHYLILLRDGSIVRKRRSGNQPSSSICAAISIGAV